MRNLLVLSALLADTLAVSLVLLLAYLTEACPTP